MLLRPVLLLALLAAPAVHAQTQRDELVRSLINQAVPGLGNQLGGQQAANQPLAILPRALVPPPNQTQTVVTSGPLKSVAPATPRPGEEAPVVSAIPRRSVAVKPLPGGEAPVVSAVRPEGRRTGSQTVSPKTLMTQPPTQEPVEEAKIPTRYRRYTTPAEVSHERTLPRLQLARPRTPFQPAKPAEFQAPAIPPELAR